MDDGHAPVTQRGLCLPLAVVVLLACVGTVPALAQSVAPPSVGGLVASPAGSSAAPWTSIAPTRAPIDCTATAAHLPRILAGRELHVTITDGVSAIDPDELLDPMLSELGRSHGDVCLVVFRYGDGAEELAGQLLVIAAVDPGIDLAGVFAATMSQQLETYGARASVAPTSLDGDAIWRIDVIADDQPSVILVHQLGDMLLLTSDQAAMRQLLEVLSASPQGSPAPSGVITNDPG